MIATSYLASTAFTHVKKENLTHDESVANQESTMLVPLYVLSKTDGVRPSTSLLPPNHHLSSDHLCLTVRLDKELFRFQ